MPGLSPIGLRMSGQRETVMGLVRRNKSWFATLVVGWIVVHGWVGSSYSEIISGSGPDAVQVGVTGHYRVGRWTAVRLDRSDAEASEANSVAIETTDGDGVRARFGQSLTDSDHAFAYAIPGGEAAPLVLRFGGDRSGDEVSEVISTRFPGFSSPSRGAAAIPLQMPWIVAVGDPMGIEKIGANDLLKRDATVAVSQPIDANDFPDSSLGYDGVDLMVVTARGLGLLRRLETAQQDAIVDWVTDGGRLLMTVGASTESWIADAPWMLRMLPLRLDELMAVSIDPSALETFTSTRVPLEVFQGVRLPRDFGDHVLVGRTTRRVSTPIATRYTVGFGQVTVVAADLDAAPFAEWPDRLGLITQLTGELLAKRDSQQFQTSRATAFNDLVGQTRSTLDQFSEKRSLGFSVISLILLSLIAAIGPLDYLLINRFLGKPLLGWLTFPLMAIGLSIALVYQSQTRADRGAELAAGTQSDPPESSADAGCSANRLEIIDIDSMTGFGRVFSWSVIYSHPSNRIGVHVRPASNLERLGARFDSVISSAFGYPGAAFGGIQIAGEDSRMPTYRVEMTNRSSADSTSNPTPMRDSVVMGLPLAPRSSKSLSTKMLFQTDAIESVSMATRPGSELLTGELVNPLPIDLLDGMLIYRNWTYLLPTRFPAGASISSVDSLRQKNFRWHLSRKKALESSSEGEVWNASDVSSIPRVTEMLMFHDAVGGERYTGLKHDPLSTLDFSHVLNKDRCVLVGRLGSKATSLQLTDDSNQPISASENTHTMIRVVLPVVSPKSRF